MGSSWPDRLFKLRDHNTSLRTEILGGATTFITMAYIVVVNPAILSFAGIPEGPSTVATILAAAFGSLLMGFYANRPIAVAPYMGENAFIAFGLAAMGIGWQQRLGTVFISGLVFALITILRVRSWLANSISASLKHSFAVGIGLFLAFIGLYETGIVTSSVAGMSPQALVRGSATVLSAPDVPVKIGNLRDPAGPACGRGLSADLLLSVPQDPRAASSWGSPPRRFSATRSGWDRPRGPWSLFPSSARIVSGRSPSSSTWPAYSG